MTSDEAEADYIKTIETYYAMQRERIRLDAQFMEWKRSQIRNRHQSLLGRFLRWCSGLR